MKKLNLILAISILSLIVFNSCDKDDDISIEKEYHILVGMSGGSEAFMSIYTGITTLVESDVSFKPLKDCKIKKIELKVSKNTLSSDSKITLRRNYEDTDLSITIPKDEIGYFETTDVVEIDNEDEINLSIDSSDSELYKGKILITIRVIIE